MNVTTDASLQGALDAALRRYEAGRLIEAEADYQAILERYGRVPDALHMLGLLAFRARRMAQADALLAEAIALNPNGANYLSNRANVLKELGRDDEAIAACDAALRIKPGFAGAWNNKGLILAGRKQPAAALGCFERALGLQPNFAEAWSNRGIALQSLELFAAAVGSYDRALALKPDYPEAWYNRAIALADAGRPQDAIDSYAKALDQRPSYADAAFGKALCHLVLGQYAQGWPLYESRWASRVSQNGKRVFAEPQWMGEDLHGKTIVLHGEQGLGDSIQFCRYAPLLADRGAQVILDVPKPLVDIMGTLDPRITVTESGTALPPRQLHSPLLSLPFAFKTAPDSIPWTGPYLRADPRRVRAWDKRLGRRTAPRIGIAWSGSTIHKSDHWRSIGFAQMQAALPPGPCYVSLQKEVRAGDQAALDARTDVLQVHDKLTDFAETAALIDCLDLVISVDTSVVHLAGALGRPAWVLIAFRPDWRWMLGREDSPWYPGVRLLRQQRVSDWRPVFTQLERELRAWIDSYKP